MKNWSIQKLAEAIQRLCNLICYINGLSRLRIPDAYDSAYVTYRDIVRLESDGAYTKLITVDGAEHTLCKNLGHFGEKLSGHGFVRAYDQHLINLHHIVRRLKGGALVMKDNTIIPRSDTYKLDLDTIVPI